MLRYYRRRNPAAEYRVTAIDPDTRSELVSIFVVAGSDYEAEQQALMRFGQMGLMYAGFAKSTPKRGGGSELYLYARPFPTIAPATSAPRGPAWTPAMYEAKRAEKERRLQAQIEAMAERNRQMFAEQARREQELAEREAAQRAAEEAARRARAEAEAAAAAQIAAAARAARKPPKARGEKKLSTMMYAAPSPTRGVAVPKTPRQESVPTKFVKDLIRDLGLIAKGTMTAPDRYKTTYVSDFLRAHPEVADEFARALKTTVPANYHESIKGAVDKDIAPRAILSIKAYKAGLRGAKASVAESSAQAAADELSSESDYMFEVMPGGILRWQFDADDFFRAVTSGPADKPIAFFVEDADWPPLAVFSRTKLSRLNAVTKPFVDRTKPFGDRRVFIYGAGVNPYDGGVQVVWRGGKGQLRLFSEFVGAQPEELASAIKVRLKRGGMKSNPLRHYTRRMGRF